MERRPPSLTTRVGISDPLRQIDVAELYLPYSFAGLRYMESMGFCERGGGPALVRSGATDMGGRCPVNPSGGVLCSNAIGATGMLRVAECALQLQGRAEARQVPGAQVALATGFGGCFWSDVILMGTAKKPERERG